jgi:NADP-dependent 3-hydroxy acid dehydrogenase YdfG
MQLEGTSIIVTGASGGIGSAIARALAAQGARLVLTGRREDPLAALRDDIVGSGGTAVIVAGDITVATTSHTVTKAALQAFGRIDILVNNAGYAPPAPLLQTSEEIWDNTIDSCLKSVFLMTRAVLPAMLKQGAGRIVQISSVTGKKGYTNRSAYCAAKWGVQGFTAALREEVGSQGIRTHVINPSAVATDWWDTTSNSQPPEVLGRMLQVDDVARAVVWVLTQPDHVKIDEIVVDLQRSPWEG